MAWNILEQSHVFIYDVTWSILGQRVLYKLALFTLNMLKLITIIYARFSTAVPMLGVGISLGKKIVDQKWGGGGGWNYPIG